MWVKVLHNHWRHFSHILWKMHWRFFNMPFVSLDHEGKTLHHRLGFWQNWKITTQLNLKLVSLKLAVVLPTVNSLRKIQIYESYRVLYIIEHWLFLSCLPCVCPKLQYMFIPVCVSVCLRACQRVWGTDGGMGPTVLMQELRIQPWRESAAAEWGSS